jgi:hypothetical protein
MRHRLDDVTGVLVALAVVGFLYLTLGRLGFDRIMSLVAVAAALGAAYWAWRAALAGRDAVSIAEKARLEERVDARIRALTRVEECLVQFDFLAHDDAQHNPGGSPAYWNAQQRLKFALIAVPTGALPTCRRIVDDSMQPLAATDVLFDASTQLEAALKAERDQLKRLEEQEKAPGTGQGR